MQNKWLWIVKKNVILDFIHCMFEVKSRKSEKIEQMKIELAVKVNEQKDRNSKYYLLRLSIYPQLCSSLTSQLNNNDVNISNHIIRSMISYSISLFSILKFTISSFKTMAVFCTFLHITLLFAICKVISALEDKVWNIYIWSASKISNKCLHTGW